MAGGLSGKTILITREETQATTFAAKIKKAGGVPVAAPLISFEKAKDIHKLKEAVQGIKAEDCLVFTSMNGVLFFFDFLKEHGFPSDFLSHCTFAAVGRKTRQLIEDRGYTVRIMPKEYVAERLAEEIAGSIRPFQHIYLFRGNLAREILMKELTLKGFSVTDLTLYETIHNTEDGDRIEQLLQEQKLDYITFTSSSTVDAFMKVMKNKNLDTLLKGVTLVSIGPITHKTLKKYGYDGIVSDPYTIDAMIDRIQTHAERQE
ncbi:uroporphyrinogen-III synthase [Metabacillus sp. cB07]|uniref:uroporphyrinogen-III synthase n=1 Tax=Metabacillus sp. cB07 TaxID=2806989 RepID=UPI001939E31C|nr:uroporphyrinogen-III synthase [Metabacillus sp. cB07]